MATQGDKITKVEGIYFNENPKKKYIATTNAEVTDMLCEGEIDGLVTKEYTFSTGTEGHRGYPGIASTKVYQDSLCSIYWNETPVRDQDNDQLNFQKVVVVADQGYVHRNGITGQRMRQIGEKLRGKEGPDADKKYTTYYKYYRILNPDCSKLIVNIKLGALGTVDRKKGTLKDPYIRGRDVPLEK